MLLSESVRYTQITKAVGAGSAVTCDFAAMNYGEHVIETFQVWPRNDRGMCRVYLTIRHKEGSGGYRHIHTEGGWTNESVPFQLSRPIRCSSPVQLYAICTSPTAQNIDFMIGVRRLD